MRKFLKKVTTLLLNQLMSYALIPVQPFLHFPIRLAIIVIFLLPLGVPAFGQSQTIDFEGLTRGAVVHEITADGGYSGILIDGNNPACPIPNAAIIYDSSCSGGCTGDDEDLGTPNVSFGGPGIGAGGVAGMPFENSAALGNLLIVHQVCTELNTNPVVNPRDHGGSSSIEITFPTLVTLYAFTAVDIESVETMHVTYLDSNGNVIGTQTVPATGDNGVVTLDAELNGVAGIADVKALRFARKGSGGLDQIVFEPQTADLRLTKTVDNAAPDVGQQVNFSVWLTNDGPNDATGITVTDYLPDSLGYISHTGGDFAAEGDAYTWNVGALAAGDSVNLTVLVSVDGTQAVENVAEVETSDQYDPDSTPGNNDPNEDDQDSAAVTPGESSGGGSGGIESDGNMATKLAQRLFQRRIDAQAQAALLAAPAAIPFASNSPILQASKSGAIGGDFRSAIPAEGPNSTIAFDVTPLDLIGITNATGVLAVDYLQLDGRRLGALFSAVSPSGALYDHSKTSCDRLGGGRLEDVRIVKVNNRPFVLSKLRHIDGAIDYAISFVAYRNGNTYTLDSHFSPNEYEVPDAVDEVINIQIWGVAPEFTQGLLASLIDQLETTGTVQYLNETGRAPQVYVMDGVYRQGRLSLRLANRVGETSVTIHGTVSRTEADADQSIRTPFEQTVQLSAVSSAYPFSEIEIETGPIFDAIVFVDHEASGSYDQLYHADGAWSYAAGDDANVEVFRTTPGEQLFSQSRYLVERSGSLKGQVTNWASLFRYLRPNGQPVDLSAYTYISFTASGKGAVRLITEKASIETWDQFGYNFDLTTEPKSYRIRFNELRREAAIGSNFKAEDVTLLAFYALGNGNTPADFEINIENLAFGGALIDDGNGIPTRFALEQNFPNPFNPSTQIVYTLAESMHVRLTVFDMLGREVQVLMDGVQPEGRNVTTFEASNLPSGLYLYRLETPEGSTANIMSLLK